MKYISGLMILLCLLWVGCLPDDGSVLSVEEKTKLAQLTNDPSVSYEDKYMVLAKDLDDLLKEAMKKPNDEEMIAHLRQFYTANQYSLERLRRDFDEFHRLIDDDERVNFVMTLALQPYIQDLKQRVPRFRERVNYNDDYLRDFDKIFSVLDMRR